MPELAVLGGKPVRSKPFPKWPVYDETDRKALIGVLESGCWGVGGSKVVEFEKAFSAFQGAKHGILVSNGTAALEVALKACGVRAGDEVIVPPYTFIATASAVISLGAIPVFVDIEPDTYNIDPRLIEPAVTPRTRAVVPVHIAGRPADLDGVLEAARRRGLAVVEDACQAPGAEWKGRKVGAIGDIGAVSFQSSKNLSCGEGGFVLTNDDGLAEYAWSHHNCGRVRQGAWYEHHEVGSNFRVTEFQAALLLSQFARFEEQRRRRAENAAHLNRLLAAQGGVTPLRTDPRITMDAVHLYVLRYDSRAFDGASRAAFLKALAAEGVPCSAGYVPLYREKALLLAEETFPFPPSRLGAAVDYGKVSCPVCERVCAEEAVWLTQGMFLGDRKDMEDIAAAVGKIRQRREELAKVTA
jgi:dTDP-4-amino-4,6-dideoxygalactose transaminase